MTSHRKSSLVKTIPLALSLLSASASAIDVDPRDYTALPEGANLSILYTQFIQADDLMANGNAVSNSADLDATIGIYRFVHFTKFMGMTVDPQVLIPFGQQELGLLDGDDSGLADTIFAATFWTHEDAANGTYFGITPFIIAPTGSYDTDNPLSLGTNRWSYVLQAGYMTRLTDKLGLDLVADVQWFGDNDDPIGGGDTLEQDELYQVQAMLSYDFSPLTYGSIRYSWKGGSEQSLDGVSLDNEVDTSTVTLGLNHWISPGKLQLQAQYLKDLDVDNGFETEALQFRVLYLFGL